MSDTEIINAVWILFDKGYTSDYQDTDYFYDAKEGDVDKAYEYLRELEDHGKIAFAKKYGL